jgi:hypothetical protein
MMGQRTLDVASKYRLSPGRISQLRRELYQDWQASVTSCSTRLGLPRSGLCEQGGTMARHVQLDEIHLVLLLPQGRPGPA